MIEWRCFLSYYMIWIPSYDFKSFINLLLFVRVLISSIFGELLDGNIAKTYLSGFKSIWYSWSKNIHMILFLTQRKCKNCFYQRNMKSQTKKYIFTMKLNLRGKFECTNLEHVYNSGFPCELLFQVTLYTL